MHILGVAEEHFSTVMGVEESLLIQRIIIIIEIVLFMFVILIGVASFCFCFDFLRVYITYLIDRRINRRKYEICYGTVSWQKKGVSSPLH